MTGKPLLGRFGRKANQPTLRRPIAAALLNDIGATSSVFPVDNCPTRQTARELKTGAATTIPSQSNITFRPYTDLLLHDMGVELADGRPDFHADGREWRTAPLWGIGRRRETQNHSDLLHDRRRAMSRKPGCGTAARRNRRERRFGVGQSPSARR